ncbi:MAG TPA: M23 family metallopeptidase [Spirochaetota bacterium]|nr:M23 family metallopeptidase [Spirochaetota bacterium]HNT10073.1 M23 family metallopeptidase [Spirochaetota bacterium]HNV46509.1 M23 family metallopeptidase [Spirochaetota bacterium]HOS38959.1 M23 family metallopeptidase [Spirochaetota bacterium]HPI23298.1 M23 family metallopeptidase [Spirochaetota bacterium]
MGLNPFKESNLDDLQRSLKRFYDDRFGDTSKTLRGWWSRFVKKGREKVTLMFIPHSEKQIVNFHISIFSIAGFFGAIALTVVVTSIIIVNHTSNTKEVSRLKLYGASSKEHLVKYREEINRLHEIFQKFKPEVTYLYSIIPENDVDSLWAKGGPAQPETKNPDAGDHAPPIELLNIEEIDRDLKITKDVLVKIKGFLEARKKILEYTPSIWPVNGYIISAFGERTSPYNFQKEFHHGIDIAGYPGAEIHATAPGRVEDIKWDPVLGLTVSVKHKYGFTTHYSHCQRVSVEPRQKISKGEVIGYVGRTGKAMRHLCYYQVQIGTEFVDPVPYLNKLPE